MIDAAEVGEVISRVLPGSARLLGWTFEGWDQSALELTVSYLGREEFLNPAGVVQGGIQIAMMDDAMGPAITVAANGEKFGPSVDLNARFLRPVPVGRVLVKARVIKLGRTMAFTNAELFDAEARLCAVGGGSAYLARVPDSLAGVAPNT